MNILTSSWAAVRILEGAVLLWDAVLVFLVQLRVGSPAVDLPPQRWLLTLVIESLLTMDVLSTLALFVLILFCDTIALTLLFSFSWHQAAHSYTMKISLFFFLPWMCFTSRPCPLVRIYLPISTSSFRSGVFKTSLDHDSVTLRRAGNPITRLDSVTCDSTLSFFIFYSIPIYKVWVSRPANTVYIRWEACFVTVQIPFNHLSIMNSTSLIRIATALIYDNVPETR